MDSAAIGRANGMPHGDRRARSASPPAVVVPGRVLAAAALLWLASPSLAQSAPAFTRASVDALGRESNAASGKPSLSADGRFVAFQSAATNLVAGDTNGRWDIFVVERARGHVTRVSVDSSGGQSDLDSGASSLEFGASGGGPVLSGDGRYVAFESAATNLVALDTNACKDVFVHDMLSGVTERVSVDSGGVQGNGESSAASISADGRFVAFQSAATNLVPGDTNQKLDVFVRDRSSGQTLRASVNTSGAEGDADSVSPVLSAVGSHLVFASRATNLVANDTNAASDVFVRDLAALLTVRASVASGGSQLASDSGLRGLAISADGARVVFDHPLHVPPNPTDVPQLYLHDVVADATVLVSQSNAGEPGNFASLQPAISADGRWVAFCSAAYNLVPNDANFYYEIFLRDTLSSLTTLECYSVSGTPIGNGGCARPSLSADGRYIAFDGTTTYMLPRDTNACSDVFVEDRLGDSATIGSFCTAGASGGGCVPALSTSGVPRASAGNGFTLDVASAPGQSMAMILFSVSGPDASAFGAGAGTLCVQAPFQRTRLRATRGHAGACDGTLQLDWNEFVAGFVPPYGFPFVGRETVWAQGWIRDPLTLGGSVLSDAVWFTVCP